VIVSEDDLQLFVDLGLTLLQAKIYISLVGTGKADVKTISRITRVSRPDIYRTIKNLQEIGLIEEQISKPVAFKAVSIKSAINFLLKRKKTKQNDLQKRGKLFIEKFNFDEVESFSEEAKIILVPSQDALFSKLRKSIDETKESIDVTTSFNRINKACQILSGNLERAWNRKIKGRVILELTPEEQMLNIKKCWKSPAAEIKFIPSIPETVMAIYDSKEVYIFTKPAENFLDSPALWTNNPGIVKMTKNYFDILWLSAM